MKRFSVWAAAFSAAAMVSLSSCSTVAPDAGEEGVLIMKPWFFGHGGVDHEPISTGLSWEWFSTDVEYVTMTPVAYDEVIDDAYSNDNTQLDFDTQIILQVKQGKSPVLIENYGTRWYANNIHKEYVSHFFQLVGNYSPFDLMSNRAVTDTIQREMQAYMTAYIERLSQQKEFPVTVNNIIVGKAKPNEDMKKEMDRTAAAIQSKKTQEQQLAYEQTREATEKQRAISDKAYMNEMNLTPQQFIQLKAWDVIAAKQGANIDVMVSAGGDVNSMWNIKR